MDRPNLTVLTSAPVTRLILEGKPVTGVEFIYQGRVHRIRAGLEVVLSLGAINTPKVLMQSGVGDETELHRFGIPSNGEPSSEYGGQLVAPASRGGLKGF